MPSQWTKQKWYLQCCLRKGQDLSFAKERRCPYTQKGKRWGGDEWGNQAAPAKRTTKGGPKRECATQRIGIQRLSFQLRRVRDHREAAISSEKTSDGVVEKGNPFIFREVFSTRRSYTWQITETHASMKFNFLRILFPGLPHKTTLNGKEGEGGGGRQ